MDTPPIRRLVAGRSGRIVLILAAVLIATGAPRAVLPPAGHLLHAGLALLLVPVEVALAPLPILVFLDTVLDRARRYRLTRGYLRLALRAGLRLVASLATAALAALRWAISATGR